MPLVLIWLVGLPIFVVTTVYTVGVVTYHP